MLNDEWRTATSQAAGKLPEPGHQEHKELELIDKKFDDAAVATRIALAYKPHCATLKAQASYLPAARRANLNARTRSPDSTASFLQ